jgi:hypothetical protein
MAHYAFIDKDNTVVQVITGRNEDEVINGISDWEKYYGDLHNFLCKRTSYNTYGNQHLSDGTPFRFNFAAIGYAWNPNIGPDGAFIPISTYPSWVLDEETCTWVAPKPMPADQKTDDMETGNVYRWDETVVDWVLDTIITK